MADRPLFSIIVPAYNAGKTVDRCLDSLLSLEGDDYEIVVVDDGSSDSTNEIVSQRSNGDYRLRLVSQQNAGVYRSRRMGCKAACGEYCLFVDADDQVESTILNALRPALASKPDMVVFNALINGKSLCDGEWLASLDLDAARREAVAGHMMNAIWNKCIRRDIVNRSRVDDVAGRLVYGEDAVQVVAALDCCDSVLGLNTPLYHYEANEASVTSTIDAALRFEQAVRKQEVLLSYMGKWGLEGVERAGYNSNCLIYCADYCKALAQRGDYRAIKRLASTPFFIDAVGNYAERLLTRGQKMMVASMRTQSVAMAWLLCRFAMTWRGVR